MAILNLLLAIKVFHEKIAAEVVLAAEGRSKNCLEHLMI